MSKFEVNVVKIDSIEPIEGADKIELVVIEGYKSIVQKGMFKVGELVAYIPEQSVVPEYILQKMELVGKLRGGKKNVVKAIKLRGVVSQGLIYPCDSKEFGLLSFIHRTHNLIELTNNDGKSLMFPEGADVSIHLGITKYEPMEDMSEEDKSKFSGSYVNLSGKTVKYDIENIKKYQRLLNKGERVVITEKLHGTLVCFAVVPGLNHPDLPDDVFIYSKGLGTKGLVFKNNEYNTNNIYVRVFNAMPDLKDKLIGLSKHGPVYLFGEIYGTSVQDLKYNEPTPKFRAFDIWLGVPEDGLFVSSKYKYDIFNSLGVDSVPILYEGAYTSEMVTLLTSGSTSLNNSKQMREGVVITPEIERCDAKFGRIILKSISDEYLTRKNATEYN